MCPHLRTFATMNTNNEQQEIVFREKAASYLVCFIDQCPLRLECLRWLVGQHVNPSLQTYKSVNPCNPEHGGEGCAMFRKNVRVMMKRGFKNMYHDMPGYMESLIRNHLITKWGRKQYFELRKGDRLVTPSLEKDIAKACKNYGWTGPIVFDDEQEDWLW